MNHLNPLKANSFTAFQRISHDKIINMAEVVKVEKDILTLFNNFKAKITPSFKKSCYKSYGQTLFYKSCSL